MKWLRSFLFSPVSPLVLGYSRVFFFGLTFLFFLPLVDTVHSQDVSSFAYVPLAFRDSRDLWPWPVLLPIPNESFLKMLGWIWKALLFSACVGLFSRITMLLAFLVGAYLIAIPNTFSMASHIGGLFVLVLGILAFSNAGDRISIDAIRKRSEAQFQLIELRKLEGEYCWPVRTVWILMSICYLSAGISKLQYSGINWFHHDTIAQELILKLYGARYDNTWPLVDWGGEIAQHPIVTSLLSKLILIFECGFCLVLFSRTARALFVPGLILFHGATIVLLGPSFVLWMFCAVFYIPWDVLHSRLWEDGKVA